jgi:tetratricopeptide (TPR) repeat protein/predicted Ser/Thr protein kinase
MDDRTMDSTAPGAHAGRVGTSPAPAGTRPPSGSRAGSAANLSGGLEPGMDFGPRFRIEQLLGAGGMGKVYKAFDKELSRTVALKTLLPELVSDHLLTQRFKQELLLASKISHRNILRIHDLGEVGGVKFITMAFIEGKDLNQLLKEEGPFPLERSLKIARQMCEALDAAHSEGVVHRDFKPQNVLVGNNDHVYVSDFGLATSLETAKMGMTRTGAVMGTPRYMSPEQVEGKPVDSRCDLYALGLVLYEMVSGATPFSGESTWHLMYQRVQVAPKDVKLLNPALPDYVARVIMHCLEKDPAYRYQSAKEILADLDAGRSPTHTGTRTLQINLSLVEKRWWYVAGGGVILLVGLFFAIPRTRHWVFPVATVRTSAPGTNGLLSISKPVTVLVADFANATTEPLFDGALEPTFNIALEGAPFISTYDRGQAHRIAAQLRSGAANLDEALARLVAEREGINVVVVGSIARQGNQYDISSKAVDALTGRTITISETTAADKNAVLRAIDQLAARVRTALGDATPESVQLAQAETFTTASPEAAHEYADAQTSLWTGKMDDAIQHYLKAVQLDPNMGRAYTGLAVVYLNKKQPQEAKKYFALALSKIDRMSDREKFRTRGVYYAFLGNTEKAIEELTQLVQQYPSDSAGMANLALSYFFRRDMKRALETGRRAVEISPKNVIQRNNVGLYAMYAGDFDAAIREQQIVLQMNPSFALAYVGTALPQLAQGQRAEAELTYHRLEQLGPQGASQATIGLADLALFEGRASEAVQILDKAIAADLKNKDLDGAATKFASLGEAYLLQGKSAQARAAASNAVAYGPSNSSLFWAARLYLDTSDESKALNLARRLAAQLEPDPQAYAKLIEGEVGLKHHKSQEALKLFLESRKLADTWMGRFDAGRAYVEAGAFAEAGSELEVCLKRRGEATALFLDESPTYHLFPPVYYYLGRAQEGLKSPAASESYKTFLAMKEKGDKEALVADARRRLGSL